MQIKAMDIIVTRYIGIRGTAILARARYEELSERYPKWLVDEAACFDENLPKASDEISLPEIELAFSNKAVYAEEYTEFGIFEALFQMSKALKTGLWTDIKLIPIKQETVEVCDYLKVNPYAMYSGYSSLIVVPGEYTEDLISVLSDNDIPAVKIGETAEGNDKIVINEDERGFLPHIRKDELKNYLGRREYYERTDFSNSGKQ